MKRETKIAYWASVGNFILIALMITVPAIRDMIHGPLFMLPFVIFILLGSLLSIMSYREKNKNRLRRFLMMTGGSAVAIPICVILHNLVYGLMIVIFGSDFWRRSGLGDEGVFFILGLIVMPIVFIVGTIGSALGLLKEHQKSCRKSALE